MARPADASGAQVARLRGFEPPTSGSGDQGNDLTRYENFGLYDIRQRDTTIWS
jgi:hypothetical protein